MKRVILALLFVSHFAFGMEIKLDTVVNPRGQTINVVYLMGAIDGMEARRWFFITHEIDLSKDTLFVLNSPGGNVSVGLFLTEKVKEFITSQEASHHKTAVVIDGQCASMCVPLYFAWPSRFAVRGTSIGLHGSSDGFVAYDGDLTKAYLESMLKSAQGRSEASAEASEVVWVQKISASGDFWTNQLTRYLAQDIAEEHGLLSPEGIVSSIQEVIEQF